MMSLSENSKLREYYLKEGKVPTQSVIRAVMTDPLADVLFKSLSPKLKVLTGHEPPLNGGGNNWYMCPKENLNKSRAVLKPIDHKHLAKLSCTAIIGELGAQAHIAHSKALKKETDKTIEAADIAWRNKIENAMKEYWNENVEKCKKYNTEQIWDMFHLFADMYEKSFKKIEKFFHEAINLDTQKVQMGAKIRMKKLYDSYLKIQSTRVTDEWDKKIDEEKAKLKAEFIENVENCRTDLLRKVHDIGIDKHAIYERIGKFLECQKIACQIYVLLKEKEECVNEIEELKCKHKERVQLLAEQSKLQDVEITHVEQKQKELDEINSHWVKKVRYVVRNFQNIITYCLHMLPKQAEFFINMEKLLLLQLNEALENPTTESIFQPEEQQFHTPVPQAKPFYLFCDRGYKAKVDQDLCPKHSGTSSISMLPAVVINKHCLYAACNNFGQFTKEIKDNIYGISGYNTEVKDDIDYDNFVPVKDTQIQQLSDLKLESSLMHILQQERSDVKNVPSSAYNISNYFSSFVKEADADSLSSCSCMKDDTTHQTSLASTSDKTDIPLSKITQAEHEREPKLKSYFEYKSSQHCGCIKKAVVNQLPAYMKNMSEYETLELPNYEKCPIETLKKMVKKARKEKPAQRPIVISKPKDASTQYHDEEFIYLCECLYPSNSGTHISARLSQIDKIPPLCSSRRS